MSASTVLLDKELKRMMHEMGLAPTSQHGPLHDIVSGLFGDDPKPIKPTRKPRSGTLDIDIPNAIATLMAQLQKGAQEEKAAVSQTKVMCNSKCAFIVGAAAAIGFLIGICVANTW